MPKYIIIEEKTGKILRLTTKRRKFLAMLQDAKDYLELPQRVKDRIKPLIKNGLGRDLVKKSYKISLCIICNWITPTIEGKCGKCGGDK